MKLAIEADNPSIVRLYDFEDRHGQITKSLEYTDMAARYEYMRFKNSPFKFRMPEDKYDARLAELYSKIKKTLLFKDEKSHYTYAGLATYLSKKTGLTVENTVEYPKMKSIAWDNVPPYTMHPYQREAFEKLLEARHAGVEIGCHRKGERVLMWDGTLKKVEDICVGDSLMGPDSTPRIVEELRRGQDTMYRLETNNGQVMFVNGHHLLVLERTKRSGKRGNRSKRYKNFLGDHPQVVLSVNEYLQKSTKFKHLYKCFSPSNGVIFSQQPDPEINPYLLGLLLGDGSITQGSPVITTADPEIEEFVKVEATRLGMDVRVYQPSPKVVQLSLIRKTGTPQENLLTGRLRKLNLWGTSSSTKFVPHSYKVGSKETRLSVLAGLMDTDGSLSGGCFDYISKSKQLADDICFIARSVGLRATGPVECSKTDQNGVSGLYYRVSLSGHLSMIPTRVARKKALPRKQIKSPNRFGFSLTKVSDNEDYFGFTLDKDRRYLTDTFLVTHNTGLGKSFIICNMLRHAGLKAVVMTPSTSISDQLYKQFTKAFGKKYVGAFFDGKKESKKLITVANAQSLTKIAPDSEHWHNFQKVDLFIADESHQCPAATLERVCVGVLAKAPYRFFFSATQTRNDGRTAMLDGITGPIVYSKTVREGVDEGYLAKPQFRIVEITSDSDRESRDANTMTREHLYYNPKVAQKIGNLVNQAADHRMPVLVLIEEVEQFTKLFPYLRHVVGFAHGALNDDNRPKVPKEFWESDPAKLVDEFNSGKLPVLVGTSCISTGTDVQVVKMLVYWQGGKSEIQVKQAIGRGTRRPPGKTQCTVVDFDVTNIPTLHKHAEAREKIYAELYPDVKRI